ncbi:MAG: hypothetical protein WCY01_01645 [Alkalispirochaeta sp.]|jgi:hypothetical protein
MNVTSLESIERIQLAIDYRRLYRARAVIGISDIPMNPVEIEFSLEMSPYGTKEIRVRFLGSADYPLVPAMKLLKEYIRDIDKNGSLP